MCRLLSVVVCFVLLVYVVAIMVLVRVCLFAVMFLCVGVLAFVLGVFGLRCWCCLLVLVVSSLGLLVCCLACFGDVLFLPGLNVPLCFSFWC